MTEVWLVRHGETAWNALGRMQGWTDVPLNAAGEAQALELRPWLLRHAFDSVHASDLSRAAQTARLAYGEPRLTSALREANFGDWEGQSWQEREDIRNALLDFDAFAAPGGETAAQIWERLEAFLSGLPTGRHLCFSHGGAIRAVVRATGNDGRIHNCAVIGVNWTERRLLFVRNLEEELAHG